MSKIWSDEESNMKSILLKYHFPNFGLPISKSTLKKWVLNLLKLWANLTCYSQVETWETRTDRFTASSPFIPLACTFGKYPGYKCSTARGQGGRENLLTWKYNFVHALCPLSHSSISLFSLWMLWKQPGGKSMIYNTPCVNKMPPVEFPKSENAVIICSGQVTTPENGDKNKNEDALFTVVRYSRSKKIQTKGSCQFAHLNFI